MASKELIARIVAQGEITDADRLEYMMNTSPEESNGFVAHVLHVGGMGYIDDCREYSNRLIKRHLPPGALK